jgi:hypothetical protein
LKLNASQTDLYDFNLEEIKYCFDRLAKMYPENPDKFESPKRAFEDKWAELDLDGNGKVNANEFATAVF